MPSRSRSGSGNTTRDHHSFKSIPQQREIGSLACACATERPTSGQVLHSCQNHDRSMEASTEAPLASETALLLTTLRLYGPIFVCGLSLYCVIRKTIPRVYAVRQWVDECKTPLADEQFGYLSWIWKMYTFETDELLETIGLDALCFLRLLNMGFRLSCVGIFNSVWLFPVYSTGDMVKKFDVSAVSINGLTQGSPRFLATVLASYIFFGFLFYTILKEFRWFIKQRHAWLQRFHSQNYTILVRNIPESMRSDLALKQHFVNLYGPDRVLNANCCMFLAGLESLVAKKRACVANLEHAIAEFNLHKKVSRGRMLINIVSDKITRSASEHVETEFIDNFTDELRLLNDKVENHMANIVKKRRRLPDWQKSVACKALDSRTQLGIVDESDSQVYFDSQEVQQSSVPSATVPRLKTVRHRLTSDGEASTDSQRRARIKKTAAKFKSTVTAQRKRAAKALSGEEDGAPDDAGFVTFKSLVAVHGALQMTQHPEVFALETEIAPSSKEIFWRNVGKDREVLLSGKLISVVLTVTLCLFWTFVVSFIVGFSQVGRLSQEFPFIGTLLRKAPWLETFLDMLSPGLLLVLNSGLLPIILKSVSRFEFPASEAVLEASTFWKLAVFTVLQTFFVSLLSGTVTVEMAAVVDDPGQFIHLLATELPARSQYFMQLLVVSTCVGSLIELFRVVPLFQAAVRANIGRQLTAKERHKPVGPFRPLSVVAKVNFSFIQARFLLYFMVLFVFSSISPLVNWLCCFFFFYLGSVYRHQFIFNLPSSPDSGGVMWLMVMRVLLACTVIAQVTLWGLLGLQEAKISLPMMIPLFVVTCLFIVYLVENFFSRGQNLPAHTCLHKDLDNAEDGVTYASFNQLYKNPALLEEITDVDELLSHLDVTDATADERVLEAHQP